jgi:hypothetical protein
MEQAVFSVAAQVNAVPLALQGILHHETKAFIVFYQKDLGKVICDHWEFGAHVVEVFIAAGRSKVKVLPEPGLLLTVVLPPCARAMAAT